MLFTTLLIIIIFVNDQLIDTADCSTSSLAKFRVRSACLDASYILRTHSAPSEVSCSVACLADSDCLTFGYDQMQGSCRLSSQCIPDTASISGNCRSGSEGEVVYTTENGFRGWIHSTIPGSNSCYKFQSSQLVNWSEAIDFCRDLKAHLAVLETETEVLWMTAHRERQYSWIGGVKRDDDWMWQWDNVAFPIEYFGWAAGQPDHLWMGTHNCLSIFGSDSDLLLSGNIKEPWKWDNSGCSHRKYCICEKNVYHNVTESSPESASLTNDLPF